jgi:FixJ family two-component response regulator
MSGDKLAGEVIAIRQDIPVIVCTGFSHQIAETKSSDTGIKALLMKPVVRSEMAQVVRKVLDEANDPT